MDRSQRTGALLMGAAVVQMFLFFIGMVRRSYMAIALPIFAALAAASGLAFWIGWTMFSTEPDLGEDEEPGSSGTQP